jgi:hypothetical protein
VQRAIYENTKHTACIYTFIAGARGRARLWNALSSEICFGFVLCPALVIRGVLDTLMELCDGCHGPLSLKERQIRDTYELQTMICISSVWSLRRTCRFISYPVALKYSFCQTAEIYRELMCEFLSGNTFWTTIGLIHRSLTPSLGHITDHLLAGHCHFYCYCPASSTTLNEGERSCIQH